MKKYPKQFRQGDVLLVRVSNLPAKATVRARENGRVILAHGEVTGHAHAITEKKVIHYVAPDPIKAAEALLASAGLHRELTVENAPTFLAVETPAEIIHPSASAPSSTNQHWRRRCRLSNSPPTCP